MPAIFHNDRIYHGLPYAIAPILIFMLTLLVGCGTLGTSQTTPSPEKSVVCVTDTDTFCIENDQQKAAKLNQMGLEFSSQENYDQALQFFNQAAALDRANPEYLYNLGLAYSFNSMDAEAEKSYLAAVAPNAASENRGAVMNARYNLACMYALQGKKDQAFEQLDKLAIIKGANGMYHSLKSDKDLASLRDDPRFKLVVDKMANSGQSQEPTLPPQ